MRLPLLTDGGDGSGAAAVDPMSDPMGALSGAFGGFGSLFGSSSPADAGKWMNE